MPETFYMKSKKSNLNVAYGILATIVASGLGLFGFLGVNLESVLFAGGPTSGMIVQLVQVVGGAWVAYGLKKKQFM